ncbi:MAG: glycosyltransferase family 2 protein [Anaerolineae bacterium]|nr:glycosyltransferase family 2 protein [Anaerolineae bacterium]
MDVLVVILNYNTRELLRECLASLHDQQGINFVTAVVDNASTDNSVAMVREEFPEVEVFPLKKNNGFSAGNNVAMRKFGFPNRGEARYVLLLNPDTVVPPNALTRLVRYADANVKTGVVGPKLILEDGSLDKACRRSFPTPAVSFYHMSGLGKIFPKSARFARYNMTYLPDTLETEVDSVVGACMLLRREAIRRAGLLDERFFMYGEDLDWCLRVKEWGYKVMYYPDVIVHHIKRASSRRSPKAQFEFTRAQWLFYHKHYRTKTSKWVHWLIVAGLSLKGGRTLLREMLA